MNLPDPFDVFKRLDPYADESLSADDDVLLRDILEPSSGGRGHHSRRRRWLAGGAVLGAIASAAAFTILRDQRASNPLGVACHRTADESSDVVGLPPATDPVAACEEPWLDGTFGNGSPPPLIGCVNDAGVASVFPGNVSVCRTLGLADLRPGRTDEQQAMVDLENRLVEDFLGTCYRQQEALDYANSLLAASVLEDWTVQLAEPFPPGSECAAAGLIEESKTVMVLGSRSP